MLATGQRDRIVAAEGFAFVYAHTRARVCVWAFCEAIQFPQNIYQSRLPCGDIQSCLPC